MKLLNATVAALVGMSIVPAAMADDFEAAGRGKLAELMAFVRDGPEQCGEIGIPQRQVFEVFGLYMAAGKKAPPEEEISAKEDELAALKTKIGVSKWCELYRIEMGEADVITNLDTAVGAAKREPDVRAPRDCSNIPPKDRTLDCAR